MFFPIILNKRRLPRKVARKAAEKALEKRSNKDKPTDEVLRMMDMVLENN
jgi:hypothetical protein